MAQPLTPREMRRQYISLTKTILEDMPPNIQKEGEEIDSFFRSVAVGVWSRGKDVPAGECLPYYNNIVSEGKEDQDNVSAVMLQDKMKTYTGFRPPSFFQNLIHTDKTLGTDISGLFIQTFILAALMFASADEGVVDSGEAAFIDNAVHMMDQERVRQGLKEEYIPVDPLDYVTTVKVNKVTVPERKEAGQEQAKEPEPTLEELMAQLDELQGLDRVKEDVKSLVNLVSVRKMRENAGLPTPYLSLHLVFMGNPGTGKTTVARLLAKIYHAIGVLSQGQMVEVDRSGLVAGYVGQTALKTQEVIDQAIGGVLFIDEAYSLTSHTGQSDFGLEAVEVLLKNMEDHRDDLIVVVAGYTDLMGDFIHSNPGLESRFNKYIYFDDYNGKELYDIFCTMCAKNGYELDAKAAAFAMARLEDMYQNRDENFGNARDARNFFERSIACQADRIAAMGQVDVPGLMSLTEEDLRKAAKSKTGKTE